MLLFSSKPILQMRAVEEEMHAFIQMIIAVKQPSMKSVPLYVETSDSVTFIYFPRHYSRLSFSPRKS